MEIYELAGLRVKEIRGFRESPTKRIMGFKAQYILFTDGKTFIEFEDQDYHDFHDYDSSAKVMTIVSDKKQWSNIVSNIWGFPIADLALDGYR